MQSDSRVIATHAVAAVVHAHVGEPVRKVQELDGFVGNRAFMARTDRGGYVLKAGDAVAIAAEAWACERVRAAGVPAPEVVVSDLSSRLLPRPYLVMRKLSGDPVDGEPVDRTAGVLTEAGRRLRAVHSITADGYGYLLHATQPVRDGAEPTGPEASWSKVVETPLAALDRLVTAGIVLPALADRLRHTVESHRSALAYRDRACLLHGDLHPRHIFARKGRMTGFIDWGDVAVGDPWYDLGRFSRAGTTALEHLLRGYRPEADREEVERRLTLYRVVWSLQAIVWEHQAGGDWFAEHLAAITDGLDRLSG
ncbi:MAG TPA: aminoglycoside phosphotransferase family protein [Actinopolymorphaceae bacterium]